MRLIILIITFFVSIDLSGQCEETEFIFITQSDVNSFPINNPGCRTVKRITIVDDPIHTGVDSIRSLLPLLGIIRVNGELSVRCKALKSYNGLDSLEYAKNLYLNTVAEGSFPKLKEVIELEISPQVYENAFPVLFKIQRLGFLMNKGFIKNYPPNLSVNNNLSLYLVFQGKINTVLNVLPVGQTGLRYLKFHYLEGGTTRGLDQLTTIDTLFFNGYGLNVPDGLFDMSHMYNVRYVDKLEISNPYHKPTPLSPKGLKNAFLRLNAVGSVVIEVGGEGIDEVKRVFPNLRQLRYGFGIINTRGFTSLDFLDRLGPIPEDRATIGEYTSFFPYLINRKYYKFAFVDNKDLVDCNSKYLCRVLDRYPELVLFRGNGCDSMDVVKYCESIDLTVAEDPSIDDMVAFPNPASDRLYIAGTHTSRSRYTLWNSMSQQVQQGITEDNEIDLSSLPGGIYLLEIEVEDGKLWRDRVVVE